MAGSVSTSNNWVPDNHYDRFRIPTNHYRVALSIPSGTYATDCKLRLIDIDWNYVNSYRPAGAELLTPSSWWLADGYLKWSDGRAFRGDNGGGAVQSINDNGNVQQTWSGGVGGYVSWAYYAPGAPSLSSSSRSSDGTTLSISINSGSGRVTGNYVSADGYGNWGWYGNGTTFPVGAHTTVTMYGLSTNEDNNSGWINVGTSYGIPTEPRNVSATQSGTVSGRVRLSWEAPSYTGAGISGYNLYLNNVKQNSSPISASTFYYDFNSLAPGTIYTLTVKAVNSTGEGLASSVQKMAPGTPPAPTTVPSVFTSGRNVTIRTARATNYSDNAAIQGYRVRYRTTTDITVPNIIWSAWSTAQDMSIDPDDTSKYLKLFEQMTPALTYQFQVYAYNSIVYKADGNNIAPDGYNFSSTPAPYQFVSAGGRRRQSDGSYQPTTYAKRWSNTLNKWVDFTTAKRWSAAENKWKDLS